MSTESKRKGRAEFEVVSYKSKMQLKKKQSLTDLSKSLYQKVKIQEKELEEQIEEFLSQEPDLKPQLRAKQPPATPVNPLAPVNTPSNENPDILPGMTPGLENLSSASNFQQPESGIDSNQFLMIVSGEGNLGSR